MIVQNDRERDCSNGDVGILRILRTENKKEAYYVELPDGRCPMWNDASGLEQMSLAYCLTVHKAQGSEYDTILLPMSMGMQTMLSRNLLYTAISRARERAIIYGSSQALDVAIQRNLPVRKSELVPKTHMLLECA